MNIVVLDGYTLNPGDLSWDKFKELGNVVIYDRTATHEIVERAANAEIILTNKTPLSKEVLLQLSPLKYIGVLATGFNVIDTAAAKARGVVVANVPGYGTASVVQMTFSLLLELCMHVQLHSNAVREGKWSRSADFCFWDYPLTELAGKTIGIIGFGSIGQKVADVAAAFGMQIVANSRRQTNQSQRPGFRWVELPELLQISDVVSIHCPLLPETTGLINAENLKSMKKTAFLINTSRGPIIVDEDLADALNTGIIAGAGIDVLSSEPPPKNNPLFTAKNCIITPHIAWATKEARSRLMEAAVDNLSAYISGNPINIVNT